ncbi:MAG TPA: hypothetical protein VEK57_25575 [Thermoanaerobaculia bacterium]|nr:hypothetical protein [Thermoanaerobaculia bacterium]
MRQERLRKGTDHCGSTGSVYNLRDVMKAGVIADPRDMQRPLSTAWTSPAASPVLIYAVDVDFNIHVGFDSARSQANAVKHETLFHNADVRAAASWA